ncbi:TIGR03032 family protein [Flammeovirga sp. SubArs3]|uniref:TIGR03032 family protein n=1 Tax=Flammeovirga sp. SubArs3 TaxID=2995316 RepID=UPI00248C3555|nr:TIGR03032 family protein [Flammeovirga sp. SubArs3]
MKPFACHYSPQVPELLHKLGCTIALSTYQAGKLIYLSSEDGTVIHQLPRTFDKPMGIGLNHDASKIALACKDEVMIFSNSKELAKHYPKKTNQYDAMYLPRVSYKTNFLDIHDIEFGDDGIYGINTLFSCIMKLSEEFSFEEYWKPKFITELVSEDRCHLNGMALENGKPKYVTCFNNGNTFQSWRDQLINHGSILDVDTNEVVNNTLSMPHSPRLIKNQMIVLESAKGYLSHIDLSNGKKQVLLELGGYVRGMDHIGDYLFVGLSRLRENSSSFKKLIPYLSRNRSGVIIIHLPTLSVQGEIIYQNSVDEIYDLKILRGIIRPNILSDKNEESKKAVTTQSASYWAK